MQKAKNLYIPKNSFLFSCDFESLYSNIDLNLALNIISDFMKNKIPLSILSSDISIIGFREILNLVFSNNFFSYKKLYFKQILGIAMGSICGPTVANIFVYIFEDKWLTIYRPIFYVRFIDDIFLVTNTPNVDSLNTSFGNLKLNIVTNKIVNFLDLNISIDLLSNRLKFSLFIKPTNTFSYLLSNSNHPNFIFNNIPKSLFIRIRRICSSFSDYLYFSRLLTSQLASRGYKFSFLRKVSNMVSNLDRDSILQYKDKNLNSKFVDNIFFQLCYSMNLPNVKDILENSWISIPKSLPILNNYKIKSIFNINSNLSSLLVHNFPLNKPLNFFYKKCVLPKCVCNFAITSKYLYFNNFYLPILSNSSCKATEVVYILNCSLCNIFYIGQTGRSTKERISTHLGDIKRKNYKSCVALHFNQDGHSISDHFNFCVFNKNLEYMKRLNTETQLIHLFLSVGAKLINDYIPKIYRNHTKLFS
jgi:hypothetical protein